MLTLLRSLIAHKGHANDALLAAVRASEAAASDPEMLALLHHVLVANRFWYLTCVGETFVLDEETRSVDVLEELRTGYEVLQALEEAWLASATEEDMTRVLESSMIPGGRCTVAEGLLQVCLHSQGHRAQAAKMLRRLGGTPPMTDFIVWAANRSAREDARPSSSSTS